MYMDFAYTSNVDKTCILHRFVLFLNYLHGCNRVMNKYLSYRLHGPNSSEEKLNKPKDTHAHTHT